MSERPTVFHMAAGEQRVSIAVQQYKGVILGWDPAVPKDDPMYLRAFVDGLSDEERATLRAVTLVDFPDVEPPYTIMGVWSAPPPERVMHGPAGKVGNYYPSITHVLD